MDRTGRSLRRGTSRLPDARDERDRAGAKNSCRAGRTRAGAHASVVYGPIAGVCPRRRGLCRGAVEALALSHLRDRLLETIGGQRDTSAGTVPPGGRDIGLSVPLRILLAEDNPINQEVALRLLERLGYGADVARDGRQVL